MAGLGLVAATATAWAGDPRCAIYGPDFVAIEGTSTCVRIGGRVRVEAGSHLTGSPNNGWGNDAMRPAGMRSDTVSPGASEPMEGFARRLRLPNGMESLDPYAR
jgi:hypothetical protein